MAGIDGLAQFVAQPRASASRLPWREARRGVGIGIDTVTLLPVIERPGKIVCFGLNYAEHAREGGFAVPDYPALFLRVNSSLIGDGAPILQAGRLRVARLRG